MNTPSTQSMQSASQTRTRLDALVEEIESQRQALAVYLPEGHSLERFVALARRAILENPAIADCSANSVLRALRDCALSGLELDGRFSSLIVRKSKKGTPTAKWDPSYRGMIRLALESGFVRNVDSNVVREFDEFHVEQGTEPKLVHRPCILKSRGKPLAAYCIVELTNGAKLVEVLTGEDIERIRALSPAAAGPWSTWADEMARKAAIRRALKKLPAGSARLLPLHAEPGRGTRTKLERAPLAELLPEELHALECRHLESLADADDSAALGAAWAAVLVDFNQRGAEVPLALEARHRDLAEAMADQEDAR